MENDPYHHLIEEIGFDNEREPFSPICNRLWMCDFERIEDHGDYKSLIERLCLLTDNAVRIENVTDFVDVEKKVAWVELEVEGTKIHWDARVDDDWLDTEILIHFSDLLKSYKSTLRIFQNPTDYGQVCFYGGFSEIQFKSFDSVSKVRMSLLD